MHNKITIYHGSDHILHMHDHKYMNTFSSNNQEGIGYYFGDLDTAKSYGDKIFSTTIDNSNFINSRGYVSELLDVNKLIILFQELNKLDSSVFVTDLQDWGIEITDSNDVTDKHLQILALHQQDQEIRNFQIDLCEKFGNVNFIDTWNSTFPDIKGTFNDEINFYCIIDTDTIVLEVDVSKDITKNDFELETIKESFPTR
jgi:hypothetical protein